MRSIIIGVLSFCLMLPVYALPDGFVHLHEVAPNIIEDMRYATNDNFTGHTVPGYWKATCIVTKKAAEQLKKVEMAAEKMGYNLKVYDCYRPQRAVTAFYQWSQNPKDLATKKTYYPYEKKKNLFKKGYIARHSGHSRGSTVDLTLVPKKQAKFKSCAKGPCPESIDMGTPFDFFDSRTHVFSKKITKTQQKNRMILRQLMTKHGFKPYGKEWWHFTLRQEPYPKNYFNFPVH